MTATAAPRRIDPARFDVFAPKAVRGTLEALEVAADHHGLIDRLALAHWLGQMKVESRGFSVMVESLNYSVVGLIQTFGRHRISAEDCERLGRTPGRPANQEAIANLVYGGAWGRANLGNTEPGDGWRFRGSGFKQITGRANIREAGYETNPEILRTDVRASAMAAANFFVRHGCLAPARADDVKAVTLKVNGGVNGLADRIAATAGARKILL
jgi:putative chitinase